MAAVRSCWRFTLILRWPDGTVGHQDYDWREEMEADIALVRENDPEIEIETQKRFVNPRAPMKRRYAS